MNAAIASSTSSGSTMGWKTRVRKSWFTGTPSRAAGGSVREGGQTVGARSKYRITSVIAYRPIARISSPP
jgi:hypothetical protein